MIGSNVDVGRGRRLLAGPGENEAGEPIGQRCLADAARPADQPGRMQAA